MENYNNRIFIQYTDKRQYNIENERISAKVFEYDISEEDLERINKTHYESFAADDIEDPSELPDFYVFMNKVGTNIFEICVDSIRSEDRFVVGGIKEGKALLQYYIVEKGFYELLNAIELAGLK